VLVREASISARGFTAHLEALQRAAG
jgi:hypothetical protein